MPEGAVYVGRGSRWGNPAKVGEVYEGAIIDGPQTAATAYLDGVDCGCEPFPTPEEIKNALAGKDLACWCPLDQPKLRQKGN